MRFGFTVFATCLGILYCLEMAQFADDMEQRAIERDAELQRVKDLTDHLVK